ncbi:MAG: B12-binding domain-containing radical SAM protein [Xenococcaceae cyanobacterium]
MRILLIYPLFPQSFWSFEKALALAGKKSLIPPLGLITVAAILPQEWEFKLVDRNIREITESEWDWAELVIISGMIVQKEDLLVQIQEAKKRDKRVAVGGPYPTALPHEIVGADYLILNEGEITLPMFVEAIERGELQGKFTTTEFADVSTTPIPRYDLLNLNVYDNMSVQFSRGCPFQCEFCDIIVLYGRKPRTKNPAQLLRELDYIYELGWRGNVFMVDDNFIGNKRNVKLLLAELKVWMQEKSYPFGFSTEASVDLAKDPELMELMLDCNFRKVFVGLETPDADSLTLTKKFQNTREPLSESIEIMTEKGLQVMAGFIIGFDNEKAGAGDRIVEFVEQISIPLAMFSMLQALPDTALWHRLQKEGRLRDSGGNINQTTILNFVPTRPIEEIAREYVDSFWHLYDPEVYLDRAFRYFMRIGISRHTQLKQPGWRNIRALVLLLWQQGIVRKTRIQFWRNLLTLVRRHVSLIDNYLTACAQLEHFLEYRQIVRDRITHQLETIAIE